MILLSFVGGLVFGAFIGMVVMSMLVASAEAREQTLQMQECIYDRQEESSI